MICAMLAFLVLSQDKTELKNEPSLVLPFLKINSIGSNPLIADEKIIFKEGVTNKLTREFKTAPVYIVRSTVKPDKIETKYEQIGKATCVFVGDSSDGKWISASLQLNEKIPENYVLRAHTVAKKSKFNKQNVLEVEDATVVEFFLKPKALAVEFK